MELFRKENPINLRLSFQIAMFFGGGHGGWVRCILYVLSLRDFFSQKHFFNL